jgi:hypothetical protein
VNPLRHFLLVVILFVAQMAAGAHAIEHVANDGDGLPSHLCQLCLTAHDLGSALPSLAALPPVLAGHLRPAALTVNDRGALPPPAARQGAPPRF